MNIRTVTYSYTFTVSWYLFIGKTDYEYVKLKCIYNYDIDR